MTIKTISFVLLMLFHLIDANLPLVINTWNFQAATRKAWDAVANRNQSSVDAVIEGCSVCEREQCDGTVGYGGSPDENGETTLDAMIMDGKTMNIGAVGALRNIRDAIAVARCVLVHSKHTMLVGSQATDFAIQMGFRQQTLLTPPSAAIWSAWKENNCQPNFWLNVHPNPAEECGPYESLSANDVNSYWLSDSNKYSRHKFGSGNHDTIGMIVIDQDSNISAGTSTNGARHKMPGRVGDSPIPGAGAYADNSVGAATATGDGDIMMRFLPSLLAVEFMRSNVSAVKAATMAVQRIVGHYPNFVGAVIAATRDGTYGAACSGIKEFPYSVYSPSVGEKLESVVCIAS